MKTIAELQNDRQTFSVGDAISNGWALVSKHLGYYILGGILVIVIGSVAGWIPFVGSLANNLIISPCFMASAVFITWRISRGIGWTDFGDLFKGFNYLVQIMVSTLIQTVVFAMLVVLFLFNLLPQLFDLFTLSQGQGMYNNQEEILAMIRGFFTTKTIIMFLLLMVALLLVSVVWAFRTHFIVIYKMEAWPAMELSRKIAMNNFFPLIGLFLLLFLIIVISAVPCGIGLLFSLPLSIGAMYDAFAQITLCDQADEVELDFKGEGNI